MGLKIVIKFIIKCAKDKKNLMKAVAKIEGINSIEVSMDKGTLTIKGNVDPVCVVSALRKKCGICVEIVTVGPDPPPKDKEEKKKPECPKPCQSICTPPCPKCPQTCHSKCDPPCSKCPPLCLPPPCKPCKPCKPCSPPPCRRPPTCSLDSCSLRQCEYERNPCPFL
ncbi:hypothetical protein EUGRSUZ_H01343 [Eucalyptus grandis]|uniref:Uncharacterized protein n=2 Tax=Eucalyptus grandis TaxID=71139 RepID=A0ACC3JQN5_EUCGR|nr:hypothetical protein EUGRSUZ_H01343 [Eucalyptus grandis]